MNTNGDRLRSDRKGAAHKAGLGPDEELLRLTRRLKSIRELPMRRALVGEGLAEQEPSEAVALIQRLLARGGRGDLGVSHALSALVSCLEPPSALPYQARADIYSAASEMAAPEVSYILLEGQLDTEEIDDGPRRVVPNGPTLTLGERKSAARTSDRELLSHLLRETHPQVVSILVDNPHLTEADALVMASLRPTHADTLRCLATHRRWGQFRRVRLAVCLNPAAPLPLACRLCIDLRDSDLQDVIHNAGSAPLLRAHADRLLKVRAS